MPIGFGSQPAESPGSGSDLWQQPPWATVNPGGGYQMGLAPESLTHWLPRLASTPEFERKAGLMRLSRLPEPVYQSLPASEAAERIAANFVMTHLSRRQRGKPYTSLTSLRLRPQLSPLNEAALQIPDDLCLLQLDEHTQEFCLVAASLCSPSYWSLSEKLGLPLSAIHEPVPGLNSQLGARMRTFFLQMPQQRCFVRRNFFVHAQQEMYQPKPDTTDYGQVSCHGLMLRSERQSLMRLSHDLLLFSIRVELDPLAEAHRWPTEALALLSALKGYSEMQVAAFGGRTKFELIVRFLANQAAVEVDPQP